MLVVDLTKKFSSFSLQAKFSVTGGITALFGRSGAGKSTLANAIAGLVTPDHGHISVAGKTLFDTGQGINLAVHRRQVGYVFQDARLFPHLTVRRNLLFGRFFNRGGHELADFEHITGLLGLTDLLDRRPAKLSGGEKQRVAVGRAILANPLILMMDEPLAALDRARQHEILPYIERLRDETSIPIIYISHSLEEVSRLADHMVLLSDGKVAAVGPPETLMSRLDLLPITGRYEAGSLLDATVTGHDATFQLTRLEAAGGEFFVARNDLEIGARIRLKISSRDVAIALEPPQNISIRNVLTATIIEIREGIGPFMEIRLATGNEFLLSRITRMAVQDLGLTEGRQVYALVKSVALDRRNNGFQQSDRTA